MGERSAPVRLVAFCLAAALLLLAAVLSHGDGQPQLSGRQRPTPQIFDSQPLRSPTSIKSVPAGLRGDARGFLAAFFRYEVSELDPPLACTLRKRASPSFAAELLSKPPHSTSQPQAAARLSRLSITVLSLAPGRALISGSARRGSRREEFSFLFEARRGTWLAVGPAE
jgi:hypothetical protein